MSDAIRKLNYFKRKYGLYKSFFFCVGQLFGFILVAICWGSTNPLIKKGSSGLEKVSEKYPEGGLKKWLAELKYLFTKWQVCNYRNPFLLMN